MFKILQFSDGHFGYCQYGFDQRLKDFAASLQEIKRVVKEQEPDLVVDTGDTFHSPDPDPYSVAAFRRFVEWLHQEGIPFLAVVGNHNIHSISRLSGNPTWMDAVSDQILRPPVTAQGVYIFKIPSRDKTHTITAASSDWMPAERIQAWLDQLPSKKEGGNPIDAVFMHQSCAGFMPVIARSEIQPEQLDGVARYVGIGDIHVQAKLRTAAGTIIGSSGSTERCSLSEPAVKGVVLIEIPITGEISWTPIPISTRRILDFQPALTEEALMQARGKIEACLSGPDVSLHTYGGHNPLISLPYNSLLDRQAKQLKGELAARGLTMLKFTPETVIQESQSFEVVQAKVGTEMVYVIEEVQRLSGRPDLVPVAQSLWANSDHSTLVQDVLAGLKSRIFRDVHNPAAIPEAGAAAQAE